MSPRRRQVVASLGTLALSAVLPRRAWPGPPSRVALARCEDYGAARVLERLSALFDQLGGIGRLVAHKTVAVKLNLVSPPPGTVLALPPGRTHQVHPHVALALATLLDRAGARRVRFLESSTSTDPIERTVDLAGWDLQPLRALRAKVEFEDTRHLGRRRGYTRLAVPGGGTLFPAYDVSAAYADCDVYVSLAKLKSHPAAGVTLTLKNNFGITPTSLYGGETADESRVGFREVFHSGRVRPAAGVPQELDPSSPRRQGYRVPRHIVDVAAARPIDLAVIDGVETISGAEGPWREDVRRQSPRLLVAGRNPVATDAIATACMGYDPLGAAGTGPFIGDNHLQLAADLGLGTNDPRRIEVVGLALRDAVHPFGWLPRHREVPA